MLVSLGFSMLATAFVFIGLLLPDEWLRQLPFDELWICRAVVIAVALLATGILAARSLRSKRPLG